MHGAWTDDTGLVHLPTTITPEMERRTLAEQYAREDAERARFAKEREAEAAEQAKAERERAEAELDSYYEQARAALFASGGTAADWATAWPAMKATYLRERAESRLSGFDRQVEATKDEMRASGRYSL